MPTKPPQDTISEQEMSANYGWALNFLKSNAELYKVFKLAVAEGWPGTMFVAKVRATNWYRKLPEATRQFETLRATDPAEWSRRLQQSQASVGAMYQQLTGTKPNAKLLRNMAGLAFKYGWSEQEVRDRIGRTVDSGREMQNGIGGTLGEAEQAIRKGMEDYGVDLSDSWMSRQLNKIATGAADTGTIVDYLRGVAKNKYRGFAQQIDQGMTIRDIAEPYRQLMAKTLEISDQSITVSDNQIQRALLAHEKDGTPTPKPLWQFEQDLANDPRWNKTQGAQDRIMSAGRKVLNDFGLAN